MSRKKVVAVIPARMGASRFPGKPVAKILDLPMIEHVRRRVMLSSVVDDVIVATCDQEIMDVVQQHGGKAVMTANTHERCTDRVEEAAQSLDMDIAIIVQGDEPLFFADILEPLVKPLLEHDELVCTNLISTIHEEADLKHQDIVKAVLDEKQQIMYFSRSPIPFLRVRNQCPMYRQTGVSAFTKDFLKQYSALSPTALEIAESVDFLRIIGHGFPIHAVIYDQVTIGVDRPEDIAKVEHVLRNDPQQQACYQKILEMQ
ncbi:MAG: 3-deoxy-manno-octulosonate cytidylyltransferase [SAR324 cluster bacterium]|nr:3-deoxy-manno-octulosonate cytidylyltransferase [SAR324 cluster bacterium]